MGCRDILLTFSVALLLISLFQIWLFREGQVRELAEDNQVGKDVNTLASKNKKDNVQRLFQRYFKDRSLAPQIASTTRDRARAITTPSDLTVSGRSSENLTAILAWFNNSGSEDGGINKCVIERFDKEAAEMYKRSFKYVWVLEVPHCAILIIDSTTLVLKLGLAEVDWRQKRELLLEKKVKGVDVKEALRLQKENNFVISDVRPEAEYKDGHPPGAINVEMYRLIREWTPWDIARHLGSAFFGIFSGTE
ncbi:hypothetical protein IGI04_026753 [Brassica rapa subsp. trilocularis]|uniref:Rhodanese domain-containing protein n=1 Tax=Brassica rapa subsp. trilocularis TaxID=1813537 RepID=A0ABQ7KZH9_BRACM|nr:hypothetical protein IGI04_026753 [Brassica rapa subsp. trilocularis]